MKVRIKEFRKGRDIRYMVQYKWWFGIWRNFDDFYDRSCALGWAKKLEGMTLPKYWTLDELEKVIEQEKKEQE